MALSIDFECPQCQKTYVQELQKLIPGKKRECTECGQPTRLTDRSLRGFERSLKDYCAR